MYHLQKFLPSFKTSSTADLQQKRATWPPILLALSPLLAHETRDFVESLGEPYVSLEPLAHLEQKAMTGQEILNEEEDDELKLLISLFSDRMAIEEFKRRMSALLTVPVVTDQLISVAVEMHAQGRRIHDLFMPVTIITHEPSMSSSMQTMHKAMKTKQAIKTLDKLVFYADYVDVQEVLRLAHKYHRAVRFLRQTVETPNVSFPTLLRRSLDQLLSTHSSHEHRRYIMSTYLAEKFYVVNSVVSQGVVKGMHMQSALADKLGYSMDEMGFLTKKDEQKDGKDDALRVLSAADTNATTTTNKWSAWTNVGKLTSSLYPTNSSENTLSLTLQSGLDVVIMTSSVHDMESSPMDLLSTRNRKGSSDAIIMEDDSDDVVNNGFTPIPLDSLPVVSSSPVQTTTTNTSTSTTAGGGADLDGGDGDSTVVITLQEDVVANILHTIKMSDRANKGRNKGRGDGGGLPRLPPFSPVPCSSPGNSVWMHEKTKKRSDDFRDEEKGSRTIASRDGKKGMFWYFTSCCVKDDGK